MVKDIIELFLLSISPLGEAKVAIPLAMGEGSLSTETILLVGLLGNLLIFPMFYKLIEISNRKLLKNKMYRKNAIRLSLRARKKTKNIIGKYGVWGLMLFVMIPIPFTGAYIGTIASYIFKINYKKTFYAISMGLIISCTVIAYGSEFIKEYFEFLNNI